MRADDFVTGDSARGAGQSSLVGTGTTNAVNTGLVGSATAIAKNMVIGGTELGDVDKMYQTGKSAIKGSVGAARVGSDLVKDTVDTAKTTAKAFKAGLNGEDIDLSGTKSRSGSNLAKGTKKAAKEGFRAAKRAAIKDSELEDVDNLYQEAKGLSKAAVSSTKGTVSNTRKSWKMLKRSTARIKALSRKRFTAGAGNKFNQQMYRYMRSAAYQSVSTGGGIINTAKNVLSYAYSDTKKEQTQTQKKETSTENAKKKKSAEKSAISVMVTADGAAEDSKASVSVSEKGKNGKIVLI